MAKAQQRRRVQADRKRISRDILNALRFDIRSVNKEFRQVPIELLKPGRYQTRRSFKPKQIKELSASLQATGMNITPLIIRPLKYSEGYEIICGERRWRAAQEIGFATLLCCIGDYDDQQALYLSGADNIQREDLNPLEEAQSYELMMDTGMTQQEVADEIGKSRSHVANHLRLLALPLAVRDFLGDERLSYAQARPLCSLASPGEQAKIAKEAVDKQWSSKKIEEAVAKAQLKGKRPEPDQRLLGSAEDKHIARLREQVAQQTGYQCVIIKSKETAGAWQIGFLAGSTDELQSILDRMGVNTEML